MAAERGDSGSQQRKANGVSVFEEVFTKSGAFGERLATPPQPVNLRVADEIALQLRDALGLSGEAETLRREDARVALASGAAGGAPAGLASWA